jgi:hypothetical protein
MDWMARVRFPARERKVSVLYSVQTASGGPFTQVKLWSGAILHSHSSLSSELTEQRDSLTDTAEDGDWLLLKELEAEDREAAMPRKRPSFKIRI